MALSLKKHEMPVQDPQVRAHNFDEVALGYDEETAVAEAERCLHCKVPQCRKGCPVSVDIPEFIGKIKERDFDGAIEKIKEANALPAVCGRVCPQENQCEKYCVLAKKGESVGIGRLERYVADRYMAKNEEVKPIEYAADAQKVAVIGSGPSGLSCAGDLAKKGYKVTVFEALHKAGGVLSYGIPEFRLPKDEVVKKEIDNIAKLGVKFELNSVAGRLFTVDELMEEEGFDAVFIGTGAGLPRFQGIPGESLSGVYSANEFLTRCNLMKAYTLSAAATWPWMLPARRCVWVRKRSISSIAAARQNCLPVRKKWNMLKKRALNSSSSTTRWKFLGMKTAGLKACAASRWNSVSLINPAAAVR